MKMLRTRAAAAGLILVFAAAACGSTTDTPDAVATALPSTGATTAASALRSRLQLALTTHVALIAEASAATFGARPAAFTGARATLFGANADEIGDVFGDAYGPSTGAKIRYLWTSHIQDVLDVAIGSKRGDNRLRDSALAGLLSYGHGFGSAVAGLAADGLSPSFVTGLFEEHIRTLKGLMDAQHTRGSAAALAEFQKAFTQAASMAASIAPPIAAELDIEGDPESRAAELRASLNANLGAHVAYLAMVADATIDGRSEEAQEILAILLGKNANAIAATFASYGPNVEKTIVGLWRTHVNHFATYVQAVRGGDTVTAANAQRDLEAYAADFGAAVHSVLDGVPSAAVTDLVGGHVATSTTMIDAFAAKRYDAAFAGFVEATEHMDEIAAALADGIVNDQTKK